MTAMPFDPTTYDDHTLLSSIEGLRRIVELKERKWSHLGTWPQKRLAILEREANRRNLKLPKHTIQKP